MSVNKKKIYVSLLVAFLFLAGSGSTAYAQSLEYTASVADDIYVDLVDSQEVLSARTPDSVTIDLGNGLFEKRIFPVAQFEKVDDNWYLLDFTVPVSDVEPVDVISRLFNTAYAQVVYSANEGSVGVSDGSYTTSAGMTVGFTDFYADCSTPSQISTYRSFIRFDTSSIVGTIESATLNLYQNGSNVVDVELYSSNYTHPLSADSGDYNSLVSLLDSEDTATSSGYVYWDVATSTINQSGYTYLGLRANSESCVEGGDVFNQYEVSSYPSTTRDPYLAIVVSAEEEEEEEEGGGGLSASGTISDLFMYIFFFSLQLFAVLAIILFVKMLIRIVFR